MPVYLNVYNLIINKESIIRKYKGGLIQFKKDFPIDNSEINQEDDELIAFGQLNFDCLDIDSLISGGLDFDEENQYSEDFTIIYRYGKNFWNVEWLLDNSVFAWHVNSNPKLIERVVEISEMTIEEIKAYQSIGVNLLTTIKTRGK